METAKDAGWEGMTPQWLAYHRQFMSTMRVRMVTAATLFAAVRRLTGGGVDALAVDTEGSDYSVVRTVIDAGERPLVLYYEHAYMTAPQRVHLGALLRREGYSIDRAPLNSSAAVCGRDDYNTIAVRWRELDAAAAQHGAAPPPHRCAAPSSDTSHAGLRLLANWSTLIRTRPHRPGAVCGECYYDRCE